MSEKRKELARVALEQRVVSAAKAPFQSTVAELRALSERFGVPSLDLGGVCIPRHLVELVPQEIAEIQRLLVVKEDEEGLHVAMADPSDSKSLEELSFVLGKPVVPLVVPALDLEAALASAYLAARRGEPSFVGPRYDGPSVEVSPSHELSFVPRAASSVETLASHAAAAPAPVLEVLPPVPELDFEGTSRSSHAVAAVTPGSAVGSVGASFAKPVTVLAIRDAELLRLAGEVLGPIAAQVFVAENSDKAVELIKQSSPNLVLLDAFLPGANAFELAVRLRSSRRFAELPLVLVSAVQRGGALSEDARRLGFDACLQRPTAAELGASILRALGNEDPARRANALERAQAGVAAFRKGDAKRAIVELERAAQLDPGHTEVFFQLGLIQAQAGQLSDAIVALERAVALDPSHFGSAKNLALLYERMNLFACSRELWQRALHSAPDDTTRSFVEERLRSTPAER